MALFWDASAAALLLSFPQEIHDPILSPVGVFSVSAPVEKSTVASVARRYEEDLWMPPDLRVREHGVRNERVILGGDNKGWNRYRVEHVARSSPVVVVGAVSIASVPCGIPVVELADGRDLVESRKVPCVWEQGRFASEPCFQSGHKMMVINPIARLFQSASTHRRVDIWTDGGDSREGRYAPFNLTGCFEDKVPAHGIPNEPDPVETILVNQFADDCPVVSAETTVIERRG